MKKRNKDERTSAPFSIGIEIPVAMRTLQNFEEEPLFKSIISQWHSAVTMWDEITEISPYYGYLIANIIPPICEVLAVNMELSRQTSNISIISSNILLIFAIFLLILNVKHTKYYLIKQIMLICEYID